MRIYYHLRAAYYTLFHTRFPLLYRFFDAIVGYRGRKLMCRVGLHTPLRSDYPDGRVDVFCQECFITMTVAEWDEFWKDEMPRRRAEYPDWYPPDKP